VLWIGLDDTDMPGTPGTGRIARELATWLAEQFPVFGVTRHQLLQHPQIPMTSKNSAAAIHLQADGRMSLEELATAVTARVRQNAAPGSDPGLCLAREVPDPVVAFGRRAKQTVLSTGEAWALVPPSGLILRELGGSGRGVIGALAAVGLAASGNDGRFNLCGQTRELAGIVPAAAILAAGVTRICAVGGEIITDGLVDTRGKLRPSLVEGLPILWVEREGERWVAVRRD
jgi:hypothetical protein